MSQLFSIKKVNFNPKITFSTFNFYLIVFRYSILINLLYRDIITFYLILFNTFNFYDQFCNFYVTNFYKYYNSSCTH